jgi:hypothetical protein
MKYLLLILLASCAVNRPIYKIERVRGQVMKSKRVLNDRWQSIIVRDSGVKDTVISINYLKPDSCYTYPITIKLNK